MIPSSHGARQVLETMSRQSVSVIDEGLDPAEASILHDPGMQSVFLVPLVAGHRPWGLGEIYGMH
ncbi:MAG: hypothetical protein WCJ67_09180 [Thermoleophilia bacterium]